MTCLPIQAHAHTHSTHLPSQSQLVWVQRRRPLAHAVSDLNSHGAVTAFVVLVIAEQVKLQTLRQHLRHSRGACGSGSRGGNGCWRSGATSSTTITSITVVCKRVELLRGCLARHDRVAVALVELAESRGHAGHVVSDREGRVSQWQQASVDAPVLAVDAAVNGLTPARFCQL